MTIQVIHGDMRDVLPTIEADSVHSVVTDPPYHLTSGNLAVDWAAMGPNGTKRPNVGPTNAPGRGHKTGFMGKQWDGGSIAFDPDTWRAVLRVLRPGGYLLAFGGTRTQHRMVCAIEDAGFEVRDVIAWVYGSGFPKSLDISKAMDRVAGAEREVVGIKPGHEGFANRGNMSSVQSFKGTMGGEGGFARPWMDDPEKVEAYHQQTAPATDAARQWNGWGTALKPSMEIIVVARRPLSERTVAANVLRHGTGGIDIDATRIPLGATDPLQAGIAGRDGHGMDTGGTEGAWGFKAVDRAAGLGRWPANLVHDGSPEVEAAFAAFGDRSSSRANGNPNDPIHGSNGSGTSYEWGEVGRASIDHRDSGTASRFFYSSKAVASDRADSRHPTVKPIDLMRWLVRLVTPPDGTVLDCFAGSGSTGEAAMLEDFNAILIEREAEYAADIKHRMKRWGGGDLPLFADPMPEDPDLARQADLWRELEDGA